MSDKITFHVEIGAEQFDLLKENVQKLKAGEELVLEMDNGWKIIIKPGAFVESKISEKEN